MYYKNNQVFKLVPITQSKNLLCVQSEHTRTLSGLTIRFQTLTKSGTKYLKNHLVRFTVPECERVALALGFNVQ